MNPERATTDDLDTLEALFAEAFGPEAWTRGMIRSELMLPDSTTWLARLEGKAVGFLILRRIVDEAEVASIGVHPGFRRRGLASALLRPALARLAAEGFVAVHLEVSEKNKAAIACYETLGFLPVGRRRSYYAPGEDALLLRADLEGR